MDSGVVVSSSSPPSHEGIKKARAAIRLLLVLVVFGGCVLLYVMMPTNTYKQIWQPRIRAKANSSTYFGSQGASLLVFTFPIMFIALMGCVYLHLGKKMNDYTISGSEGKTKRLAVWKQPMLVKGPLGIVSGIELTFFIMFIALLIWSFSTYLTNSFHKITPQSAAKSHEKVWEVKLESASLRLGLVGNICLALLFFPVDRGSSILPLFGLTSEASIKYHIWLGHIVMVLFTAHGIGYIIYWAVTDQISEMIKWAKNDVSNIAGEIALLSGLAMWVTTIPRIRRNMFELFFYTHYLYILFMVFFIFHVGVSYAGLMLPGFFLFVVDRYLRFLQSGKRARLVSARVLPGESFELNFAKSPALKYNPTSVMFINVPSISKLQWHPFTVTSNSNLETDKISVVIKGEGSWTRKLHQVLSSPSTSDRIEVAVEGPYGPAATHFLRHDSLVLVSGGSGITPFISIIRELIFMSTAYQCKLPKVTLICAFKHSSDLTMLDLILPMSSTTPYDMSNLQIQIEAYVTRDTQPKEDSINLRAIWFKPLENDEPISAILGANQWLWLGLIIASSFMMFLILIGIITRYYIYPIDHNSNKIFSFPLRALLNMLAICISIAATASAVVLWSKRSNDKELKQVQHMEASSPSRGSEVYNTERELESLPQQSLLQATNVHYGQRPDLKRILFECKGSNIGVLASGPKKMRHEVATFCSSGLAENMHFESISFSW
ncbi:hypothetical protein ACLB2K_076673 [Fragaria x ananassa]